MKSPTIKTLVEMMEDEELVLPAMQRPFVWQEERILYLMDSLMRGFPIGMLLIWETDETQRYRGFSKHASTQEKELTNFSQTDKRRRVKYALDGQQRLTSLLIAVAGSLDGRKLYLDVLSGPSEKKDPGERYYNFRFLTSTEADDLNTTGNSGTESLSQHFIEFGRFRRLDLKTANLQANKLAQKMELDESKSDQVVMNFSSALDFLTVSNPLQIHVVDAYGQSETPIAEILELFVRVNSGGLVLNKSDLLMSLLDMSWNDVQPQLMRISKQTSVNSPVSFSRDLILKSALLIIKEDSRFDKLVKDRQKVERIAPKLREIMPLLETGWKQLAVILRSECRIQSPRFFRRATNALLPFAVFLAKNPSVLPAEKHHLVVAVHLALMSGVFAGAEARMGQFARNQCLDADVFPLKELAKLVKSNRPISNLDLLLGHHRDLTLNIAQGNIILDDNPDELERDHIFPKSTLSKENVEQSLINHYANFHFLRQKDNRNKTDKPPHTWFKNPGGGAPAYTEKDLKDRLLEWELIEPEAFSKLISVRGKTIRDKACELFHMTEEEFNALFE